MTLTNVFLLTSICYKTWNEIDYDYFWFVSILCSFWFLLGCFLPVFPLKFHYLLVWVSAWYWSSLPDSSRSLGTAPAIGFGMKSLLLCFVFISLFSGVAVVGVWLDLVFGLSFLLIDLHFVVAFWIHSNEDYNKNNDWNIFSVSMWWQLFLK